MIFLLFGDDESALFERVRQLRKELGGEIVELAGKEVDFSKLRQVLESPSLFSTTRTVIIGNFLDALDILKNSSCHLEGVNLILWEAKKLSARQIESVSKLVGKIKKEEFLLPVEVFKFLQSIRPGNTKETLGLFHKYLKLEAVEIAFVMIVRQMRMMLLAKAKDREQSIEWKSLSPWQKGNFERQAKCFEEGFLIQSYKELLRIDYDVKTGKEFDLVGSLDDFLLRI